MIRWSSDYICNIPEIDAQHKKLFELLEKLYEIVEASEINPSLDLFDEIIDTFEQLKDYTIYHFQFEEGLHEKYNYPEKMLHQKEHKTFVNKFKEIDRDKIEQEQDSEARRILEFIEKWISLHISKNDAKFVEYFQLQKV